MKQQFLGKLVDIHIRPSLESALSKAARDNAFRVTHGYMCRTGGSFKMVISDSDAEIERKIRNQIIADLRHCPEIAPLLEFRFNTNPINDGMVYEGFSVGSFTWYPVINE